jgi:hypothetical protein
MLKVEPDVPSDQCQAEELYMEPLSAQNSGKAFPYFTIRQASSCCQYTEALAGVDISGNLDRYPRVYSDRTLIRGQTESVARAGSRSIAQCVSIYFPCLRRVAYCRIAYFKATEAAHTNEAAPLQVYWSVSWIFQPN